MSIVTSLPIVCTLTVPVPVRGYVKSQRQTNVCIQNSTNPDLLTVRVFFFQGSTVKRHTVIQMVNIWDIIIYPLLYRKRLWTTQFSIYMMLYLLSLTYYDNFKMDNILGVPTPVYCVKIRSNSIMTVKRFTIICTKQDLRVNIN